MTKRRHGNLCVTFVLALALLSIWATAQADPACGYELQRDVIYGRGRIAPDGTATMRNLKMDVYTPTGAGNGAWPAVVCVHGGAFHRGGRMNPSYRQAGVIHSSPEDWDRLLAANGYKVFVIKYRMVPQNPILGFAPGDNHTVADVMSVVSEEQMPGLSRARKGTGLPMMDHTEENVMAIRDAYMSGIEDAALALNFVVEDAGEFNIDPKRIAMGGHSAGARIWVGVGLGLKTPLKAIFPMSSPETLFDKDYIAARTDLPAVLTHFTQSDDEPVLRGAPGPVAML